jgi:two-component system response regulator DevR
MAASLLAQPRGVSEAQRTLDVLLVEEHALMRAGLRSLIGSIPGLAVAAEASSMSEAHAVVARTPP